MDNHATPLKAASPGEALAGLLAGREKLREQFARRNAGISKSWTRLGTLLGDELGELEAAGEQGRGLDELDSASARLHRQFLEASQQLEEAREEQARVEASFEAEYLARRRRRTAFQRE